jgi:hypothetical protein
MWILTVSIITLLLIISYQDFTKRLISWYYFPLAAILLLIQLFSNEQYYTGLENIRLNIIVIFFLLLMTTILVSLKNGTITFILDKSIGLADIFSFGLICIALSPINLVIFLLISFITSAVFQLVALPFSKNAKFIPLAGIVGVLLSIGIFLQDGLNVINLTNDFQTLGYIGGIYTYW